MSLSATQQQFTALLADQDCSTIALSGRWGTGKSFLWKQVQANATDERVQGALYASLFGLASIEDLKLRLLQSALLATDKNGSPRWGAALKTAGTTLKKLEDVHPAF